MLIVLFVALTQLHDYKTCNSFMTVVKDWQPKVMQCLKPEELQILLRRQTDTVLKSQSVMYEMFHISTPVKGTTERNYSQEDFNY